MNESRSDNLSKFITCKLSKPPSPTLLSLRKNKNIVKHHKELKIHVTNLNIGIF